MKYRQYLGILLGALYGLGYRLLCEKFLVENITEYNIYSISFIWVVPIVIGIIPILFASEEILKSWWKQILFPILSVLLFFVFALTSGLEDWLCILLVALPFLVAAGVVGIVVGQIIKRRKSKHLYSILLLPLLLNPLESRLPNRQEAFEVQTSVVIDAPNAIVWNNLVEVPEISEDEFDYGFFNFIGVPRPVKSALKTVNGKEYRIGYFTGGLKLYESISQLDSLQFVNFKIHIDQSELRDLPTDKHLLNSHYFNFENISYRTEPLHNGQTRLTLHCDYSINSKMNGYANFWASRIVKDFEVRLLKALKVKIERQSKNQY